MRRGILAALSWLLTAVLGAADVGLVWLWRDRLAYVETFGAAENLRAAEEAANAGAFALLLLPLFLAALICAIICTKAVGQQNGGGEAL